jgi:hypothetical protein
MTTTIRNVNYDTAIANFVVANTPIFLLRKLRSDSCVWRLAQLCSADELFSELAASLANKPESLADAVKPYALVAALAQKGDLTLLREIAKHPAPFSDWFSEITNILIQTTESTATTFFMPPQYHLFQQNKIATDSPTKNQNVSAEADR